MDSSIQFISSIVKAAYRKENGSPDGKINWERAARTCNGVALSFAFDAVKFFTAGKYDYLEDQITYARKLDEAMKASLTGTPTLRKSEYDGHKLLIAPQFDFIDHAQNSRKLYLSHFQNRMSLNEVTSVEGTNRYTTVFSRDDVAFEDLGYDASAANATNTVSFEGYSCNRLFKVFADLSGKEFNPESMINQIKEEKNVFVVIGKPNDTKSYVYQLKQENGGIRINEVSARADGTGEENIIDKGLIENLTFVDVKSQYETATALNQPSA